MKPKVILGMSGGVDSSVAALFLQKQGYEVIGFFMNASPSGKPPWPSTIKWQDEESILRKLCKKLNIKLIVKDCEKGYEENVIAPMFASYKKGFTPNPDILCNNVGKFPSLLKIAEQENAQFIATGHYARIKKTKSGFALLQGKDKEKDQSYFLVGLNQKILSKTIFPIGNLKKSQVREIAKKAGFPNFDKRSSRGICYLGKIDMKSFLKQRIKEKKGKVLNPEGQEIGTHDGAEFFTIGERLGESKGFILNKAFRKKYAGKKLFVARKEKGNVLIVAPGNDDALKTKEVFVKTVRFVNREESGKMKARIRHLGDMHSGKLEKGKGKWKFVFSRGVRGVADGQFIVFYKGERLVGGGEIKAGS